MNNNRFYKQQNFKLIMEAYKVLTNGLKLLRESKHLLSPHPTLILTIYVFRGKNKTYDSSDFGAIIIILIVIN